MKEQLFDILSSVFSDEIARSFLTAFLGGFVVYFFAIKQKKHDRINSVDDSLIARRMDVYKEVEGIISLLNEREIIPFYPKECRVRKLNLNRDRILYIHPLYNDINQVNILDKKVSSIISCSPLVDGELMKWIYLLHMYNENIKVLYDGIGNDRCDNFTEVVLSNDNDDENMKKINNAIRIKYLSLLAHYDIGIISHKISKSIKRFYSSPKKLKFKEKRIDFHRLQLDEFSYKLNVRKYLDDDGNIVNKIIHKCLLCNEDCILAGKHGNSEKSERKGIFTRIRQFTFDREVKQQIIYKTLLAVFCMLGVFMGATMIFSTLFFKNIIFDNGLSLQGTTYGITIEFCLVAIFIEVTLIFKAVFFLRNSENGIRFPYFFFIGICLSILVLIHCFALLNDIAYGVLLTLILIAGGFSLLRIIVKMNVTSKITKTTLAMLKTKENEDK